MWIWSPGEGMVTTSTILFDVVVALLGYWIETLRFGEHMNVHQYEAVNANKHWQAIITMAQRP